MTVQKLNTLVGENIRHYRKSKGWYARTLAKKTGLTETAVSTHEHGHHFPSPESLLLYAFVLDVEVWQLFR
jgi:transcriptional regulator with XRE-family HTH domain